MKAVLPLVLVTALVAIVIWLPSALREFATKPIVMEKPREPVPVKVEKTPAERPKPVQTVEPPKPIVVETPPPPLPDAAQRTLMGWSVSLKGMACASAVVPDSQATLKQLMAGPFGKASLLFLKDGVLVDPVGAKALNEWNNEIFPALQAAVAETQSVGIYLIRLPGERVEPVVAAVPAVGGQREMPALVKLLNIIDPDKWEGRQFGGSQIRIFGAGEALDILAAAQYDMKTPTDAPAGTVFFNVDGSAFTLIARLTGEPDIAPYATGLKGIEGSIIPSEKGFEEQWRFDFEPGDNWPLMSLGGPPATLAGLGSLPGTSLLVAGGYLETDAMLPVIEKSVSEYVPGLRLSDLRGQGLDGAGFAAIASSKETWQPTVYGVLEPRGEKRAIEAFSKKYAEALSLVNLREGTSNVGQYTAHYPMTLPDQGATMLLSLFPAWAEVDGKLFVGMSALGIKEMLTGRNLTQEQWMVDITEELPKSAAGVVVADMKRLAYLAYEPYSRLIANQLRLSYGLVVSQEALPTPDVIMTLMRPLVVYSTSAPGVVRVKVHTPIPVPVMLAAGASIAF